MKEVKSKEGKVGNGKGEWVEPTLPQMRLMRLGWHQYYHHEYWVNPKTIMFRENEGADYTNYGMAELEALAFEKGFELGHRAGYHEGYTTT